jgi:NAD-dependent dihydropyrimidine dehydrogenase PreA subunit
MIELIYPERCNGCGLCVKVCPTNVLSINADGHAQISAQSACQTCFMCELYCATDALYVDPDCAQLHHPEPDAIRASGLLGHYRRDSGWDEWADHPQHQNQHWRMDEIFALAREAALPPLKP